MNKMKHQVVGKVFDLKLNNEGNMAEVIVARADENDSKLVMGQFVILTSTQDLEKVFIGTIESENMDGVSPFELKESLKQAHLAEKEKVDRMYMEKTLFSTYRCRMLGVCYDTGKEIKYYSNIRTYPSPTALSVAIPSHDFMNRLFLSAVSLSDNDTDNTIFEIGKLQYGTYPEYTKSYKLNSDNEVKVQFNATNLLRKRTAIFGKSGYGKSNTVKTVIGMMSTKHSTCGQLILDTNGEYALDNNQNDGLMDIFHEAGYPDKCVLYTNRNVAQKTIDKYGHKSIKQLKFDVFDKIKPAFEIVASNLDGRTEPLYLNPWSSALDGVEDEAKLFINDNLPSPALVWGIWYAALFRAGLEPYNKKHTKTPLTISKDYLAHLVEEVMGKNKSSKKEEKNEDGEDNSKIQMTDEVIDLVVNAYSLNKDNNHIYSTDIKQIADYAEWYVENKMKDKSSVKGFSEILEYPRRFYALKSFNLDSNPKEKRVINLSLGENIFRDLKDNKIVILDLASVSIQVAKTLAQHVLTHLLSSASKMFGDYAMKDQFSKFDALVYIEEAQNYLKTEEVRSGSIYERVAKEGRKFHIGLVYVTQQPSAIDPSITSQTENIIAMHMSNSKDCFILGEIKDKFDRLTCKFLKDEAQKGLAYLYAEPHQPFVLPCQIHQFNKNLILDNNSRKKKN